MFVHYCKHLCTDVFMEGNSDGHGGLSFWNKQFLLPCHHHGDAVMQYSQVSGVAGSVQSILEWCFWCTHLC